MPLKPIFDKAPLTAMNRQPLRAGMMRADSPVLQKLYALIKDSDAPCDLEAAFRLAYIVTARPMEEAVTARIRAALGQQREDGSFTLPHTDSVALLRAAWALYEYEARKPLLEHIARWCAWAAANWDDLMADDGVWAAPADLMELLENLYRVTGKAAVLGLCERVATQTMSWAGVLNTLSSQRPTNRSVTRDELADNLNKECGSREGYYTQFVRTNHPESLADGARSAFVKGLFTGSATELNAAQTGWEKLWRHHGAVCGSLTSDELLEGTAPNAAVSTAALGAWCEALCAVAMGDKAAWAWEAIERMALNAMPACLSGDAAVAFQWVNTLTAAPHADGFHVSADHDLRALTRLARAYAALASVAVTVSPVGAAVNLYLPGRYAVMVGDHLVVLTMTTSEKGASITVHCKKDVKAALSLRIPTWSRNSEIAINGADANGDPKNDILNLDRVWQDGDVITILMEQKLRIVDAHHQGKYVLKGAVLMALPVDGDGWAQAFAGAREENGRVSAALSPVRDWKARGGGDLPADIPVLPDAPDAPVWTALAPYAKTGARIALFPGRKQA